MCPRYRKDGAQPAPRLSGLRTNGGMLIVHAFGQHGPCNPCQLVGNGDDHFVPHRSGLQTMNPRTKTAGVVLDAQQHGTGTVNEHAAQIRVAALADAE